ACFFDFARQNQKNKRSFILLFRLERRNAFYTIPPLPLIFKILTPLPFVKRLSVPIFEGSNALRPKGAVWIFKLSLRCSPQKIRTMH
ncbi:MAG: hypothetical protein ACOYOD_14050, partial [Saprospiraceae bacterium]